MPLLSDDRAGDLVFHAIQQDEDGTIRLSTSKGFILVDPAGRTSRMVELIRGNVPLEVTGLFRTGIEEWFVGTETGIFRYDPRNERILPGSGTGEWSNYHADGMFQSRAIWRCPVGGRDLLILGALGYGHIAIDPITATEAQDWNDYRDEPGTMMLRSTLQDAHGMCWSATQGGVVRWTVAAPGEEAKAIVFSTRAVSARRLPGDDAQALTWRGDTLWVTLRDAGLASIVGDQAHAHLPPAHMPHDALGVTIDPSGYVWCTTSDGLLRYTPWTGAWLHIPVNNGQVFRQLTKCILALKDGRIALCADDHLLFFDPRLYDTLPGLPVPGISGISNTWGDLRVDAGGTLGLPYRNTAFDVLLTALQPVGAAPLTFLYRLDSEQKAAHVVNANEPVRYAGVPGGSHRLLVRVRDAYGREGPEVALLTVRVAGPFWQQWWFFLFVLAMGALGMYAISRLRQRQRLRLQGVRDRIARDLHDDIGSTLGSISFYSEALKRKLENTPDRMVQEVAEKIGSSSREMVDQMSDIVWSVDPKNDDAGALSTRATASG
ncbi:MAG: histidine kinase dimerization/phosphoacceptor domain-containing protein, partial [Flavobacteriales bacterium]